MTITYLSEHAMKAVSLPEARDIGIELNLREVAPSLLQDALHPELLAGPASADPEEQGDRGKPEFYVAIEHRIDELNAAAADDEYSSAPDGRPVWRELTRQYSDLLSESSTSVAVPMVRDLIGVCERSAEIYESCKDLSRMEQRRRRIAGSGPGCGRSVVTLLFHHFFGHLSVIESWLGLAAYLAARLDAVGRVLVPAGETKTRADAVPAAK